MDTWCIGCHNTASPGGGFDLSTYNGVAASVANNKLLGSIKHMTGFIAMPQGGDKLQDCDINAIEKWINGGFPNN